jgi:hypothetical protein
MTDAPSAPRNADREEPAGTSRSDSESRTYWQYIRSSAWLESEARLEELRRAGYRCRICNRGPYEIQIEVHHRTYARLGHERPEDLTTLCIDCHRLYTDAARRARYAEHRILPCKVLHVPVRRFLSGPDTEDLYNELLRARAVFDWHHASPYG